MQNSLFEQTTSHSLSANETFYQDDDLREIVQLEMIA